MKAKEFLINTLKGGAIGVAMIIPGVSGGTIAVLLKVYDKLINCISDLKRNFKQAIKLIVPLLLGAILAFIASYFPLTLALKYALLPTVATFAGLMTGSLPKMFKDTQNTTFNARYALCFTLPFILVIAICFVPNFGNVELTASMNIWEYIALLIVGIVGSCALIVPGISGSMLLMILGYYQPILQTLKGLFSSPLHSVLILAVFAVGVVIGFFTIAKLMKFCLDKFPHGTRWAILGFAVGSVPAIFIVNFSAFEFSGLQIATAITLFIVGTLATWLTTKMLNDRH